MRLILILSDPNTSFLAARYFTRALTVFSFVVDNEDLDLTARIWKLYLSIAAKSPDLIEWPNIDSCIKQDGLVYASPLNLSPVIGIPGLAQLLVR